MCAAWSSIPAAFTAVLAASNVLQPLLVCCPDSTPGCVSAAVPWPSATQAAQAAPKLPRNAPQVARCHKLPKAAPQVSSKPHRKLLKLRVVHSWTSSCSKPHRKRHHKLFKAWTTRCPRHTASCNKSCQSCTTSWPKLHHSLLKASLPAVPQVVWNRTATCTTSCSKLHHKLHH